MYLVVIKIKSLLVYVVALVLFALFAHSIPVYAQEFAEDSPTATSKTKSTEARSFDDVLNELLDEFSYDLKTNQIQGLKNISIRRIALSEAIPKSYEPYLESITVERFRTHSKIRIMQCTTCKVKKSIIENGKLHVVLPINSNVELNAIAEQLGIETWIDIALLYQETNMVLAFNAFDSKTKELVWTKVYNSESIYRKKMADNAAFQQGNSANEAGKPLSAQIPERVFVFGLSLGYQVVPNVTASTGMLGATIRGTEKFDKGHSEVGALLNVIVDPNRFLSSYTQVQGDPVSTGEVTASTSKTTIKPFTFGMGLFAQYSYNFFSGKEDLDRPRFSFGSGLGGIVSTGYLAISVRSEIIVKLGKHFTLGVGGLYSAPTTISIKKLYSYKTVGGMGFDVAFGILL